ncbi:MAG: AtpZ/AtpI family protein [Defluviitaleaceae bacterium]|nr:AtpZ/AtpI family protein [Defluviitaleaceae bacterium]
MMTQIGLTMAFCVLGGVLFGVFLDSRLDTTPWFTIALSLLGCVAAFKAMYDIAKKI